MPPAVTAAPEVSTANAAMAQVAPMRRDFSQTVTGLSAVVDRRRCW